MAHQAPTGLCAAALRHLSAGASWFLALRNVCDPRRSPAATGPAHLSAGARSAGGQCGGSAAQAAVVRKDPRVSTVEQTVPIQISGREVARYVTHPELSAELSPRPYLHPVRTLSGTVVSDALTEDHRWHLGVGLAVQDVDGTNLWGGRTYVRGQGYTWLNDHGQIKHVDWRHRSADAVTEHLRWQDPHGEALLSEERTMRATLVLGMESAWLLDFGYRLTNVAGRPVSLGSPATNGRLDGAGYGGFFWRAVAADTATVCDADANGEELVNGSASPWLSFSADSPEGGPYTLVFMGLSGADRWFVRTAGYPGICAALAFEKPLHLDGGQSLTRRHRVLVADGALGRDDLLPALEHLSGG